MRRDQKIQNHLYYSTISPNVTLNYPNNRIVQRESAPIQQYLPPNRQQQRPQRTSNSIDNYSSNNLFAHLKNEIGNLRSEFAKLKRKEGSEYVRQNHQNKKQQKPMIYSVIIQPQDQRKKINNAQNFRYSEDGNVEKQKNMLNYDQTSDPSKYNRKYTFQTSKFSAQNKNRIENSQNIQSDLSFKLIQMENQNKNLRNTINQMEKQINQLQNSLQTSVTQKQQLIKNHKSEKDKYISRNDEKIMLLQRIHQQNMNQILQKLKQLQQSNRKTQVKLIQKESQCQKLQRSLNLINEDVSSKAQQLKKIKNQNFILQSQIQNYLRDIQLRDQKCKVQQKIVESDQSKQLILEIHHLSQQLQIKQNLIRNLCHDVKVLDNQVRSNMHLKSILASNLRYIEDLNHIILKLECQRLNSKYMNAND